MFYLHYIDLLLLLTPQSYLEVIKRLMHIMNKNKDPGTSSSFDSSYKILEYITRSLHIFLTIYFRRQNSGSGLFNN